MCARLECISHKGAALYLIIIVIFVLCLVHQAVLYLSREFVDDEFVYLDENGNHRPLIRI